ncbi:MAG TPA: toll/interleukin-1 receptor domain-containing protein, partial [Myxococcales bacterium]|nr:toll/interleukin-1 receptor domain-containing protein [Myxococcales bacterium]
MERGPNRRFFISYSHGAEEDERLCARFAEALTAAGHEVFFDKKIQFGSEWADEIQRQLNRCDSFLLLLSETALASEMVQQEVERARNRRKAEGTPRIFTVRVKLEGDLPYRWAAYLDAYQWRTWRGEADFVPILQAIQEVGGEIPRSPEASGPAQEE